MRSMSSSWVIAGGDWWIRWIQSSQVQRCDKSEHCMRGGVMYHSQIRRTVTFLHLRDKFLPNHFSRSLSLSYSPCHPPCDSLILARSFSSSARLLAHYLDLALYYPLLGWANARRLPGGLTSGRLRESEYCLQVGYEHWVPSGLPFAARPAHPLPPMET